MDALGCMQSTVNSDGSSNVRFEERNSPDSNSLLCNFGNFYLWCVNCRTVNRNSNNACAIFPSGITVNHLFLIASNPPRYVEQNPNEDTNEIEPLDLKAGGHLILQSNVMMAHEIQLSCLTNGIRCAVSANSQLVSLQFIII